MNKDIIIERLERELKEARERNEVQNKYWHNIGVERNTLKERVPFNSYRIPILIFYLITFSSIL